MDEMFHLNTWFCGQFGEIAINGFDFFLSHYRINSAEGVTDPPQIRTRFRSSHNGHLPGAFKFAQCVEASDQFSPPKI